MSRLIAIREQAAKWSKRPSGDGTTAISDTVLTQTAFDANSNTIRLVDDNGGGRKGEKHR